jgi:aquaporin related protein
MNTARAFGPAVVSGFQTPNHWVVRNTSSCVDSDNAEIALSLQYWLGPFLGSLLGTGFYALLKQYVSSPLLNFSTLAHGIISFHYWTLNPDQATSDPMKSPADPIAIVQEALVNSNELVNFPLGGNPGVVKAVKSSEDHEGRKVEHSSIPTAATGHNAV